MEREFFFRSLVMDVGHTFKGILLGCPWGKVDFVNCNVSIVVPQ